MPSRPGNQFQKRKAGLVFDSWIAKECPVALEWGKCDFKIGINMAGAISAGAYTAGVLDFLVEALDEWQKAKDACNNGYNDPSRENPPPVPLHDVTIEVFSGASAGGMCAAIGSTMVQHPFTHIKTCNERDTTNTFYESWVNKIDIRELLGTRDIVPGKPLASLLDCTIIDRIADYALAPQPVISRPFISPSLTLFLTLSNVRGIPYRLYNDPAPTVEEFTSYYGDRLRFEITQPGVRPSSALAKPLPLGQPDKHAWPLLKETAKATGAFPIFLAPRVLTRDIEDYKIPLWEPLCSKKPNALVSPAFPPGAPSTWETLNVDGGVIDNDPFELAHGFLASSNPCARDCHNPREPDKANCAVITVAPFPAEESFDEKFDVEKSAAVWPMIGRLASVLISQSRFSGESLQVITSGVSFSRFVIAPSDPNRPNSNVLQCGLLGAFGGFFERSFRAHDFLLGRRNCQRFLTAHFVLPTQNPVIVAGLERAGTTAPEIRRRWCVPPPSPKLGTGKDWMPIIPLCGTAVAEVTAPPRGRIAKQSLRQIVDLIIGRLKGIGPILVSGAPYALTIKLLLRLLLAWPVSFFVKRGLRRALTNELRSNVAD